MSEYGITNVKNPIHLNRVLRREGFVNVRIERGLELLDAGASEAFAVADHQVAHIYVKDKNKLENIKSLIAKVPGVERVLSNSEIAAEYLDHERCGDLVAVADADSWFTYYFWMNDAVAPDYARMVDIHKKPGYDPVEMMTDPKDKLVMVKVAWKLLKKILGFRTVLDITPLDASLIKGSHGRLPEDKEDYPIFITNRASKIDTPDVAAVEVYDLIKNHVLS